MLYQDAIPSTSKSQSNLKETKNKSQWMGDVAIGIDLGTTNSCAAYYYKGRVRILENDEGGRTTPSYLLITEDDKIMVGYYAKRMASAEPEHAIYEIKRLVGLKFDDPYIQKNLKYFPFKIENDSNNPVIVVEHQGRTIGKTPQELCTSILAKIKKDSEEKLGQPIDKAVITVPAYFNVTQREVTLAAANQAGFTVLKLLNEPTAAALSYYLENDIEEENYSIVYDLGGGTFDVVIVKRSLSNIDVVAVDGDTHLGGHDFNNLILDYACAYLRLRYEYNSKSNTKNMKRLYNECEEAKKMLSLSEKTTIILNGFVKNVDCIQIELTRKQFENMADKLFQKTIDIIDRCLKNSKIEKSLIKAIIMSGGSTRIPKIQKMISDYFDGKTLNKFVNPDECVAEGAALQAAMLSKNPKQVLNEIRITDVVPLSLGISDVVDRMTFLIKKNSPLPASTKLSTITVYNKQTFMNFDIYEGERLNAKENRHLGSALISNITPAPPGQCTVFVGMDIDENGILTITAEEEHRSDVKKLRINYTRGHRSESEIKNALKDADENKQKDRNFEKFADLKEHLLVYCEQVKYDLEKNNLLNEYKHLYELCNQIKERTCSVDDGNIFAISKLLEIIKEQCGAFL